MPTHIAKELLLRYGLGGLAGKIAGKVSGFVIDKSGKVWVKLKNGSKIPIPDKFRKKITSELRKRFPKMFPSEVHHLATNSGDVGGYGDGYYGDYVAGFGLDFANDIYSQMASGADDSYYTHDDPPPSTSPEILGGAFSPEYHFYQIQGNGQANPQTGAQFNMQTMNASHHSGSMSANSGSTAGGTIHGIPKEDGIAIADQHGQILWGVDDWTHIGMLEKIRIQARVTALSASREYMFASPAEKYRALGYEVRVVGKYSTPAPPRRNRPAPTPQPKSPPPAPPSQPPETNTPPVQETSPPVGHNPDPSAYLDQTGDWVGTISVGEVIRAEISAPHQDVRNYDTLNPEASSQDWDNFFDGYKEDLDDIFFGGEDPLDMLLGQAGDEGELAKWLRETLGDDFFLEQSGTALLLETLGVSVAGGLTIFYGGSAALGLARKQMAKAIQKYIANAEAAELSYRVAVTLSVQLSRFFRTRTQYTAVRSCLKNEFVFSECIELLCVCA